MKKRYYSLVLSAGLLLQTHQVLATNGYFAHGSGPVSKSMAGACVAMRVDAMCANSNSGAMAFIGNQLEVGAALFSPDRGFTADNNAAIPGPRGPASIPAGTYDSDNDFFLIPYIGYNKVLDSNSTLGVTFAGNGGMNTEYDATVFRNFANPAFPQMTPTSPTGIDLKQAFLAITYARKLNDNHGFGISPIIALQSFKAQGLQPFTVFSNNPDSVTNNGTDYSIGLGLRLGWSGQISDKFRVGVSYQSRIYMNEFDKYKGLFAEGGDFDIPPVWDIGFAIDVSPDLTLSFDYQRIQYSKVESIANPSDIIFMPGQTLLGIDGGMGFGWDDMSIYKVGLQWKYNTDLTLRAGFSYATDAFDGSQGLMNMLAPAVVKRHITFGLSKKMSKDLDFNTSVMFAPKTTVYGSNPNTGPQTGSLQMSQWEIELGIVKRF